MKAEERKRLLWMMYVTGLGTWAVLTYGTLVGYLLEGTLFAKKINGQVYVNDFVNHYNASRLAKAWIGGDHLNVYDITVQDTWARKLIAPLVPEQPFYFQLPPEAFAFFAPLMVFPTIGIAWCFWSVLWLAVCLYCMFVLTRGFDKGVRASACLLMLAAYPTWLSVELGQTSFLVFACITGMYWCFLRRQKFLAGLFCSLISIKIQYLPIFGLVGLILGGSQFLLGCIAGGAALFAATFACIGWDNIAAWPQALLRGESSQGVSGVAAIMMQNFRAFLALVMRGDSQLVHVITVAFYLLALSVTGWFAWRNRDVVHEDSPRRDGFYAFVILLALISSVHAHTQDYILACLACWFAYRMVVRSHPGSVDEGVGRKITRTAASFGAVSWLCFYLIPVGAMICLPPFLLWAIWFSFWILRSRLLQNAPRSTGT